MSKKYRATCDLCSRTLPAIHDSQDAADRHAVSLGWVDAPDMACHGCQEALDGLDDLCPRWKYGQGYAMAKVCDFTMFWFAWRHPGCQAVMSADVADVTALTPAALLESIRDSDPALWDERIELTADVPAVVRPAQG